MKFKIKLKRLGIVTLTALMLFTNINIKAFEGITNGDASNNIVDTSKVNDNTEQSEQAIPEPKETPKQNGNYTSKEGATKSENPTLKENLGNEPPLITKNENGLIKDITSKKDLDLNKTLKSPVTPLEIQNTEIWIKDEVKGLFVKKKINDLTETEKEKYKVEIESELQNKLRGVRADSNVSLGAGTGYSIKVYAADGVHMDWNANYPIVYVDGEVGFCIEPGVLLHPGGGFTPSLLEQHEASIIAYEGWEMSSKTNEDYLATQFMIWEAVGGSINSTSFNGYASYKTNIQNKIDHHWDMPSFQNNNYEVNVGQSITIPDANRVLNKFSIVSTDGVDVRINGNDLVVTGTLNSKDNATIKFTKINSKYVGTSIAYSKSGSQTMSKFKLSDPLEVSIKVKVNKFGSVSMVKQDEDGARVPNTTFQLSYNSDMSNPIGTFTTGANGTVLYDQLLPQTVYIKETAVPNHLVLDSTIRSIQVIANSTVSFTATNNWVKGKVKIRKTDSESGKQVAGATYAIFNGSNQEIQRFVTTRNGYTESGYLRFGNYYVKEVIAPTGYLINETKYSFTISTNEQKIDITGTDTRAKGRIVLEKQDQETGAVAQGDATLDGAVYGLYAKDNILNPADNNVLYSAGQLITSMTTKDRKATFDNLYLGSYFVKEITPPAGYLLDTKEYPITLSYKNQNTALIRVDRVVKDDVIKGDLEIQKTVDAKIIKSRKIDFNKRNTRSALKDPGVGFKFDVTHDKSGTLVGTMTTDENGFAEMKDLPYGWYTITEQKTEGYDTLAPFKVFVSTDKKVYKFAIENTALRAYVKLVKKDADTGKTVPLAGYKFKIKDKNGNYVKQHLVYPTQMDIDTFVTAADGSCTLPEKLIYGTYYLEEVAVEGDYVRNPNPVEFKVDGTIATVVVEMPNKAVYGRINLLKSDYDTKETLSGVTYQLTANDTIYTKGYEVDAEGNRLIAYKKGDAVSIDISEDGYYVTDEKGEIHINNLPLGKYAIKETKNLEGYIIDEKTYEFELKYQDDATEVIVKDLEYTNKLTQIEFEKMDMENEKHIKGAELKVLDAAGNVIDAWTTSDDIHIIRGLIVGQTYTLREDYAPKGYMIAKDKVFTVENEKTQRVIMNDPMVQILKVDASNNKEIPEATLQIISTKTKQIVDQWVTTDVPYNPSGLIEGEAYILHELEAPKGYVVAKDVPFTTTNGMNQKIIMSDPKMEISKVDANDKKAVVGAKLQVISKATDEVVDEWITTDTAYNPSGLVVENEYILREVEAPKGYIVAKDVPFTTTSEPIQKITMSDPQLEVNKVDSLNGKAISGATLQIISTKTKQIVDQWVTTEEIYNPSGLIEGEDYILHELEAPKGYIVAKDIPFTTTNEPVQKIVMSDPKMEISKVDTNDKKAVVGATLQIISKATDEVVDEWITSDTAYNPSGLIVENEYILREVEAPKGYIVAKDVPFTTTSEPVQKITMSDPQLEVNKVDSLNGKAISGATLQIISTKTKQIVDQWVTTDAAYNPSGLIEGEDYILREMKAPVGFFKADDMTFNVTDKANQKITMKDAPILKDAHIKKVDSLDHENVLAKAEFTLFEDKDCTKAITTVKSGKDGLATFKDLRYGKYYAKETKAPAGYILSKEIVEVVIDDKTMNDYIIIYENTMLEDDVVITGDTTNQLLLFGFVVVSGSVFVISKKRKKALKN